MVSQRESLQVRVGNTTVDVAKSGSGDALVYLHGAFGYQAWPEALSGLAEHFTVYAPLQPGFSENDGIDRVEDLLDLVLFNFDVLEALDLESANAVGHFTGAMIAAEMAAIRPSAIEKLVLAAPAGFWLDSDQGADYFATPARELKSMLFSDPSSSVAALVMPEADDDEGRALQMIDRVRSLSTVGKFLWPIPDKGLKRRIGRIKSPTLIIMGDGDKIVPPAYGDYIRTLLPSAAVDVIERAGHMMQFERPDTFARLVSNFLRG